MPKRRVASVAVVETAVAEPSAGSKRPRRSTSGSTVLLHQTEAIATPAAAAAQALTSATTSRLTGGAAAGTNRRRQRKVATAAGAVATADTAVEQVSGGHQKPSSDRQQRKRRAALDPDQAKTQLAAEPVSGAVLDLAARKVAKNPANASKKVAGKQAEASSSATTAVASAADSVLNGSSKRKRRSAKSTADGNGTKSAINPNQTRPAKYLEKAAREQQASHSSASGDIEVETSDAVEAEPAKDKSKQLKAAKRAGKAAKSKQQAAGEDIQLDATGNATEAKVERKKRPKLLDWTWRSDGNGGFKAVLLEEKVTGVNPELVPLYRDRKRSNKLIG